MPVLCQGPGHRRRRENTLSADFVALAQPIFLLDFIGTFTLVVSSRGERLSIRSSEVELSWYAATGGTYQAYYRSDMTTNTWREFGQSIVGDDLSHRMYDSIPERESQR